MLLAATLLLALAPVPSAPIPSAPIPSAPGAHLAFPTPSDAIQIQKDLSMSSLIDLYSQATGQACLYNDETRNYLQQSTVGLNGSLTVPPDRFQEVFEAILNQNDFLLAVVCTEAPRIVKITSLNTGARVSVRSEAVFVPVEDLALMRSHPAMLLTTVVDLPRLDVRQLANAMRTMLVDANTQQMLPAGNTNSLVLTGRGAELASTVEMLRLLNDLAPEPEPQPVPEQAGQAGQAR